MDSLVDLYADWMEWPLVQEYYGFSGFLNAWYWSEGPHSQQQACENLSDKLLSLLPQIEGNILDVACGNGATTRALLRHYPAPAVVGINLSQRQLERCRQTAVGCTFLEMNAVDLQFKAETFNTVICTEAAFHFRTRRDFFREAFRILKPGAHLLLADIVFGTKNDVSDFIIPGANTVASVDDYRARLAEANFDSIDVLDATLPCWNRYTQNLKRWLMARRLLVSCGQRMRCGCSRTRLALQPIIGITCLHQRKNLLEGTFAHGIRYFWVNRLCTKVAIPAHNIDYYYFIHEFLRNRTLCNWQKAFQNKVVRNLPITCVNRTRIVLFSSKNFVRFT